jgi:metal transporter CNNM
MTYLIILILILFSALFSGLTIGLLGLDKSELEIKMKTGDKRAVKIYSVRKNGNLLLVTLLLGNVLVNSILSVYLGDMFSGLIAVIFSTALIVVFGEILPQAIFYRHAMLIGMYFVPVVKLFQLIFFPVAWPIAKILDKFLGEERMTVLSKEEMSEMIKSHEDSVESEIDNDEESILLGALSFSDKKVKEIMTPKNVVFMLEENEILDDRVLTEVKNSGFSRIPIYQEKEDKIVGVLNVKSLINLDGKD